MRLKIRNSIVARDNFARTPYVKWDVPSEKKDPPSLVAVDFPGGMLQWLDDLLVENPIWKWMMVSPGYPYDETKTARFSYVIFPFGSIFAMIKTPWLGSPNFWWLYICRFP